MKKLSFSLTLIIFLVYHGNAQKIPLTHEVYEKWNTLDNPLISNDGKWICYEKNPQKGDGWLMLYNTITGKTDSVARGKNAVFSPLNQYLVFKITPQYDTIRAMKLRKVKKEKLPKDSLCIWFLHGDSLRKYPYLKSFKMPENSSSCFAALFENETETKKEKKDSDSTSKDTKKEYKQLKSYLIVFDLLNNYQLKIDRVDDYNVSRNGLSVMYKTILKDSVDTVEVLLFNTSKRTIESIFKGTQTVKNLILDDNGVQAAFIVSADTTKQKAYSLYLKDNQSNMAKPVVDSLTRGMIPNWCVSENGKMYFSKDGKKLYFNTCPKPEIPLKDTLLEEEKFKLDIWKWDDKKIQSQQNKELQDELKRSYLAVFNIAKKEMFQVESPEAKKSTIYQKGNARYALLFDNEPYLTEMSWTGNIRNDVWLVDLEKKNKTLIFQGTESNISLSPSQKYFFWYSRSDSNWFILPVNAKTPVNITAGIKIPFWNEDYDMPDFPPSYGYAGWSENDAFFVVYDQFDIWAIDPEKKTPPVNITRGEGRKNRWILRYISLNKDEESLNLNKNLLLSIFDKNNMQEGFMMLRKDKNQWKNQLLTKENYKFSKPVKAKNAEVIIWQKQNYQQYPELYYSHLDFSEQKQVSFTNPQQQHYLWGKVSLYFWKDESGEDGKGLLYVPEDFDSNKKYPLIVYYYERDSEKLHVHYTPKPSASVINFPLYNSNGYIIFVPDIRYKTGYPGESALKTVVSGTKSLISKGFVDEKKIGLQGQSWGGYQTAYIITQTNMFCAAMAGAAVSNMTSAYTGIRWESGLSRMFQYEKGQSRIGKTLWEDPQLYLRNSPLFFADKINTPLLMMNNDNDGAVPWQQGIELYSAMRRLQKPCWMLVYNNEEHNLKNWPNKVDLSIRMMQFFDHYLKDKPMPGWMKNGLPATEKGKKSGY